MDKLKFINEQMDILAVPYEFGEWTSDIKYPYFVGELPSPEEITTEDGKEETTMFLTGFHRGKIIDLEMIKKKIKKHFNPIVGLCGKTDSGSIAVFFDGSFYLPTGEADLKKLQINLKIKEWKGDFYYENIEQDIELLDYIVCFVYGGIRPKT